MSPDARAETNWVRMPGVFAVGNVSEEQLQLPVEAPGIAVIVQATKQLRLSPDFDIVVWLGERWLATEPLDPDGWVHFTWYELVKALYGAGEGSGGHRTVRASFLRLMSTLFTVDGYDAVHKRADVRLTTTSAPVQTLSDPKRIIRTQDLVRMHGGHARLSPDAARRFGGLRGATVSAQLASWMCLQLANGGYTYLDFATLRKLDGAAKRTWVYLQAEKYQRDHNDRYVTVIGLGPPALQGLGVGGYAHLRQARAALKRAGEAICRTDYRYESIEVRRFGNHSYQLRAVKLSPAAARARARALRGQEAARSLDALEAAREHAREAVAKSAFAPLADRAALLRAWPADARHPDEVATEQLLDDTPETLREREAALTEMVREGGPFAEHARQRLAQLWSRREPGGN